MKGIVKDLLKRAYANMERNVLYFEPRFLPFGLIAVTGFPLYFFIWHYLFPQPYENLPLRLFGSLLFIPVMFAKYWSTRMRHYLPIYWYLATLFALPFFFTFMLLKNEGNTVWLLSALASTFLMLLLFDWLNLFVQFILGTTLAWLAYILTTDSPNFNLPSLEHLPVYLFIIVIGAVANYSAVVIRRERLRAMMTTASTIAHELRTPLTGIKAGAGGLKQHLPALLKGYRMARDQGLSVEPIREVFLNSMDGVLERIESEIDHSITSIDMLLNNTKPVENNIKNLCSMISCIETALQRYPFSSEQERELIKFEKGEDFKFYGNDVLMMHVLFNLIKNAIYHVTKAGKGDITIRLVNLPDRRQLIFMDTGPGIPSYVLPHIFTRFYSWKWDSNDHSGTGIGLAYCRSTMESIGGSITCNSIEGQYSQFVLTFPVAND